MVQRFLRRVRQQHTSGTVDRRAAIIGRARAFVLAAALVGAAGTGPPAGAAAQSATSAALTPLDYVEIKQLVARYAYAVDAGTGDGAMYAGLFAPDGAFVDSSGREIRGSEALAALARRNVRGPQAAFHFIMNHVIEPSPDGATGRQFLLQLRIGDGERPNEVFGGGRYDDVYVRTPDGWRFKRRQFTPSEGGPVSASAR